MVEMRCALLDYMDQHHESHLAQVNPSSALKKIRHSQLLFHLSNGGLSLSFFRSLSLPISLFLATVISLSTVMLTFPVWPRSARELLGRSRMVPNIRR
jgi:hypothetical protein